MKGKPSILQLKENLVKKDFYYRIFVNTMSDTKEHTEEHEMENQVQSYLN